MAGSPFWTLRQAVAWIAIGETRDVSELHLIMERAFDRTIGNPEDLAPLFEEARAALLLALDDGPENGGIAATGRECVSLDSTATNTGVLAPAIIPAAFWGMAELDLEENRAGDEERSVRHWWRYQDITFNPNRVKARWPVPVIARTAPPAPVPEKSADTPGPADPPVQPAQVATPNNAASEPVTSSGSKPKGGGRPPGAGSLAQVDAPLVERMRESIRANRSLSPYAAALTLAGEAQGGGTLESKAKRLTGRYSAKFRQTK
jgi:hypothetical protein